MELRRGKVRNLSLQKQGVERYSGSVGVRMMVPFWLWMSTLHHGDLDLGGWFGGVVWCGNGWIGGVEGLCYFYYFSS